MNQGYVTEKKELYEQEFNLKIVHTCIRTPLWPGIQSIPVWIMMYQTAGSFFYFPLAFIYAAADHSMHSRGTYQIG